MKVLKGMGLVAAIGFGVWLFISLCVILLTSIGFAALITIAPKPVQPLLWNWALEGVSPQSDADGAILPVGGWVVPYDGYNGPTSFICQVPVMPSSLTDCFGSPRKWGYHHGLDFGAVVGTPVRTPIGGKVVYAAYSPVGYGNLVVVENQGYQVFLAHNSRVIVFVGQIVRAGDIVAYSGNTGASTGPHLHFEVRKVSPEGASSYDPATIFLPGQTSACNWYHLVPASERNTKGCEKRH